MAGEGEEEFRVGVRVEGVAALEEVIMDADVAHMEFHALGAEVDGAEPASGDVADGRGGPGFFGAVERDTVHDAAAGERGVAVIVSHPGRIGDAVLHT